MYVLCTYVRCKNHYRGSQGGLAVALCSFVFAKLQLSFYLLTDLLTYLLTYLLNQTMGSDHMGLVVTKPVFGGLRTTKAQPRLRIHAV